MARRRITEEPVSRLAIWARRLALFSLAIAILGTVIVRAGLLEIVPALATVAGGFALALIAMLFALAALVVIWREGIDGLSQALIALLVGAALLAYPGYLAVKAYRLPPINDITTDTDDPPRLEVLARIRPREYANPVTYPKQFAALQQETYPDIEPLDVSITPLQAFEVAYKVITKRKWRIVDARRPQSRARDGHIEAVARTPIMAFRDDVVVRIHAVPDGARIDVRSASRYGWHDFGTNASRVIALLSDIDAAADEVPQAQQPPEPPPQPAPRKRPSARR
jgi:uncharacterized protein (DUF1499 family)